MAWYGYTGNILEIDLKNKKQEIEKLGYKEVERFIGGFGINTKIAADIIDPKVDPLDSENPIIIGTGPLVGTIIPGASRIVGTTKFPASDVITSVCGSTSFGMNMKLSGYDHVILKNKSNRPVYLEITDEYVKFHDASSLWGRDIYETTDDLRAKHGYCGVIAIGAAGENLVKFSMTLVDKFSTFGRAGLAAIMGSKKLKAIIVKGKKGIKIARRKEFWRLYKKLFKRIKNYPKRKEWQKLGLMKSAPLGMLFAASGEKEKAKQCSNKIYLKKLKKHRFACPSCPLGDKDVVEIKEGKFSGLINYSSSVLNAFLLLTLKGLKTYDQAIKAFDTIQSHGLDAMTINQYLEFCTDLYQKGVLTKENTGIELKKDLQTLLKVCDMIVKRKGFGDILADGWKKLIEKFEDYEKDMLIVKGVEQIFDPRMVRLGTMEFEQVVNPKGAHVASGGSPTYFSPGRPLDSFKTHFRRMGIPEEAFDRIFDPPKEEMGINVGRLTRYSEDWYTVLTSLCICARAQINRFYSLNSVTKFYNVTTGFDFSPEDIRKAAERSWNLMKILNTNIGFDRTNDRFPESWFETLKFGKLELKLLDSYAGVEITRDIAEQLIDDYYDERGWDIKTGIPTTKKLKELDILNYKK
ncbi:MAG: hypothetical protein GF329_06180 [Candidatus Lokiarchaeota archaeon]|nr:hypothetical protein [Candidatus Lokiarchaeota archaeon]